MNCSSSSIKLSHFRPQGLNTTPRPAPLPVYAPHTPSQFRAQLFLPTASMSSWSFSPPWALAFFSCSLPWSPACSVLLTYLRSCSLSLWAPAHFLLFASMSSCLYMFGLSFLESVLVLYFSSCAYLYYLTVLSYPFSCLFCKHCFKNFRMISS